MATSVTTNFQPVGLAEHEITTNFKPVALAENNPQTVQEKTRGYIADVAGGTLETGASLATGTVAGAMGYVAGALSDPFVGHSISKEWEDAIKNKFTYQPRTKSGKGAMDIVGKVGQVASIPRNLMTEAGGEQWGRVGDALTMAALAKTPNVISSLKNVPTKAGEYIYRKTLKPAGTIEETAASVSTGFQGKFWLTKKGYEGFKEVKSSFDRSLNQIKTKYANEKIPQNEIIDPLYGDLMAYAEKSELPITHMRAVEKMIDQRTQIWGDKFPDGKIPFGEVQEFKQTLYQRYNNAYGETKKAMSTEGSKAFARSSKEALDKIAPELSKINPYEKRLIHFKEDFEKALVAEGNEKFTITNTIINNHTVLTSLAKVFRSMSPDHMLGNPAKLRAYLKDIPSPTVGEVMSNGKRYFLSYQRQMPMENTSGQFGRTTTIKDSRGRDISVQGEVDVPPLTQPTQKAIGHDTQTIYQGMEFDPTTKSMRIRDSKGQIVNVPVEEIKAQFNNPEFWAKNKDLTNLRLKLKTGAVNEGEMNTLLYRVMQGLAPSERRMPTPLKQQGKGVGKEFVRNKKLGGYEY